MSALYEGVAPGSVESVIDRLRGIVGVLAGLSVLAEDSEITSCSLSVVGDSVNRAADELQEALDKVEDTDDLPRALAAMETSP